MKTSFALLSLLGGALAQGVTESIAPKGSYPDGCSADFSGSFEVTIAVVKNAKRDLIPHQKRSSCASEGILVMTLANGTLTDSKDRTGYIASNYQFQFDDPAQAGAIYTSGFSVCGNDSLALGSTTTFWQCKSGSFWNLYDRNWAEQCEAVQIIALPCGGDDTPAVSQTADGQVVATEVITTTVVKTIGDGQVQAVTTTIPVPICQIGDGQVQGHSTPCASITVATTEAISTGGAVPVSQYSDGQIQVTAAATTAAPATTAPAVATTAVCQISDGQVQAGCETTVSAAPATTAPAATTTAPAAGTTAPAAGTTAPAAGTTAPAVCQISDGQVQAGCETTAPAAGTTAPANTTVAVTSYSNSTTFASVTSATATPAAGTSAAPPAGSSAVATSGAVRLGAGLTIVVAMVAAVFAL